MKVANTTPDKARSFLDAYVSEIAEALEFKPMTQVDYSSPGASLRLDAVPESVITALEERGWGHWAVKGAQLPPGYQVMVHKRRKFPLVVCESRKFGGRDNNTPSATVIRFAGLELPRWNDIIQELKANEYGTRKLKLGKNGLVYGFQRAHGQPPFPEAWGMKSVSRGTAFKKSYYVSDKLGASAIVLDHLAPDGTDTLITWNLDPMTME